MTPPSIKAFYSTAVSAFRAVSREYPGVHVVGYSVGTAAAARVCAEVPGAAGSLLLIAPMVSGLSVLEDLVPWLRAVRLVASSFDTLCVRADAARTRGLRVSIVHGSADTLIRPRHGRMVRDEYAKGGNTVAEDIVELDATHQTVIQHDGVFEEIARHVGRER